MPCLCGLRLSRTNAVSNNLHQWQKDKDDGQSRDVRWDGGDGAVKGLGVRIYPSGKKSFVLSYRDRGQKQLMVIGDVVGTGLTLDKVRRRAGNHLDSIRDGKNPLEEKRAAGRGTTLSDLIDDFMDKHVAKRAAKTSHAIRLRLNRNIPAAWKSRRADAIKTGEIEDLHQRIGETRPYEANRLLENLRTMYRHAPRWGYTDPTEPPPTDGIDKFPERKRWVRPEELPAFAQAIDGESNIYVRAAIWLYLLTGVRKAELLQARWIDFYNHQRPHSAHGGRTPVLVYRDGLSPSGPGLRPDLRSTDLAA